jgi:hypothetical protein
MMGKIVALVGAAVAVDAVAVKSGALKTEIIHLIDAMSESDILEQMSQNTEHIGNGQWQNAVDWDAIPKEEREAMKHMIGLSVALQCQVEAIYWQNGRRSSECNQVKEYDNMVEALQSSLNQS